MTSNTPKIDENPPAPPQRSQAPRKTKLVNLKTYNGPKIVPVNLRPKGRGRKLVWQWGCAKMGSPSTFAHWNVYVRCSFPPPHNPNAARLYGGTKKWYNQEKADTVVSWFCILRARWMFAYHIPNDATCHTLENVSYYLRCAATWYKPFCLFYGSSMIVFLVTVLLFEPRAHDVACRNMHVKLVSNSCCASE